MLFADAGSRALTRICCGVASGPLAGITLSRTWSERVERLARFDPASGIGLPRGQAHADHRRSRPVDSERGRERRGEAGERRSIGLTEDDDPDRVVAFGQERAWIMNVPLASVVASTS